MAAQAALGGLLSPAGGPSWKGLIPTLAAETRPQESWEADREAPRHFHHWKEGEVDSHCISVGN